jgi:hypothetical protein
MHVAALVLLDTCTPRNFNGKAVYGSQQVSRFMRSNLNMPLDANSVSINK